MSTFLHAAVHTPLPVRAAVAVFRRYLGCRRRRSASRHQVGAARIRRIRVRRAVVALLGRRLHAVAADRRRVGDDADVVELPAAELEAAVRGQLVADRERRAAEQRRQRDVVEAPLEIEVLQIARVAVVRRSRSPTRPAAVRGDLAPDRSGCPRRTASGDTAAARRCTGRPRSAAASRTTTNSARSRRPAPARRCACPSTRLADRWRRRRARPTPTATASHPRCPFANRSGTDRRPRSRCSTTPSYGLRRVGRTDRRGCREASAASGRRTSTLAWNRSRCRSVASGNVAKNCGVTSSSRLVAKLPEPAAGVPVAPGFQKISSASSASLVQRVDRPVSSVAIVIAAAGSASAPGAMTVPLTSRNPWRPNAPRIRHSFGVPFERSPSSSSVASTSTSVDGMSTERRSAPRYQLVAGARRRQSWPYCCTRSNGDVAQVPPRAAEDEAGRVDLADVLRPHRFAVRRIELAQWRRRVEEAAPHPGVLGDVDGERVGGAFAHRAVERADAGDDVGEVNVVAELVIDDVLHEPGVLALHARVEHVDRRAVEVRVAVLVDVRVHRDLIVESRHVGIERPHERLHDVEVEIDVHLRVVLDDRARIPQHLVARRSSEQARRRRSMPARAVVDDRARDRRRRRARRLRSRSSSTSRCRWSTSSAAVPSSVT